MAASPAPTLLAAALSQNRSPLDLLPRELKEQINLHVLTFDKIVITSKHARGVMGPVRDVDGEVKSTFSFSTTYSSSISEKAKLGEYRWMVQQHIINDMRCTYVTIKDFQFTNASKLIKTLEKNGKLQDFLLRPNEVGMPNRKSALRGIIFIHHVTKHFSSDFLTKIEQWNKQIERLRKGNVAVFHMEHRFPVGKVANMEVVRQCVADLGSAGALRNATQRDTIAKALRKCLGEADVVDREASRRLEEQDSLGRLRYQAFREQEQAEADGELLHDENEYEDNEPEFMPEYYRDDDEEMMDGGDEEMLDVPNQHAQAAWGALGAAGFPGECFILLLLSLLLTSIF